METSNANGYIVTIAKLTNDKASIVSSIRDNSLELILEFKCLLDNKNHPLFMGKSKSRSKDILEYLTSREIKNLKNVPSNVLRPIKIIEYIIKNNFFIIDIIRNIDDILISQLEAVILLHKSNQINKEEFDFLMKIKTAKDLNVFIKRFKIKKSTSVWVLKKSTDA